MKSPGSFSEKKFGLTFNLECLLELVVETYISTPFRANSLDKSQVAEIGPPYKVEG